TSETTALYQKIRVQARQMAAGGATALSAVSLPTRRTTLPADVTSEPGEAPSTEEGVSHNLPSPLTSFIGRDKEFADLKRLLGSTRLLTLTGTGGSGKTRLALEIAGEKVSEYADGVWLVTLASLSDPSLVVQAVASVFDIREQPGKPLLQTLVSALRSKALLLLLDNCEHLLKSCGTLAAILLRACPSVQLLTTSRERLGIAGEQIYRVPSLSLPDLTDGVSVENLQRYESVRLFVARACLTRSDFQVTPRNARALAQICHRLDGIPLAIELAAAWVNSLSVADLLHRLDDRFNLLTGGDRSALPRQQTLRGLIDWSYDLLSGPERKLFQQLSVFAGGWTLEAAEFVCAEQGRGTGEYAGRAGGAIARSAFIAERGPALRAERDSRENGAENVVPFHFPGEILDLLSSLVDKSLVIAEEWGYEVRYRLLETMRQYAHEWLLESGESDAVRKRHQDYFLALAETPKLKRVGVEQGEWLQKLEREHENLRAALDRSLLERETTACLRFCGALSGFWRLRGHVSEGQEWSVRALGAAGAQQRSPERAKALNTVGGLVYSQGDYPSAQTYYEECLAIYRELGDRLGTAQLLNNLGAVAFSQSNYTSARAYTEESLAVKREMGDQRGIADSLHNLGTMAHNQGDYGSAWTYHRESLALRRENGDRVLIAWSLNDLGSIANTQGDYGLARTYHEESLALRREIGDRGGIAYSLLNLGNADYFQGNYVSARSYYEESLGTLREIGDRKGIAQLLYNLGAVAFDQGDYGSARTYHEESLALRREIGDQSGIAQSLEAFAGFAVHIGKWEAAASLWGAAEALREQIRSPQAPGEQADNDRKVAAARETLGEEAFTRVWEKGKEMTIETAITLASVR
ncbi:MAG TPA: tetratricopeptide repeat protein, partial [Chthonomonadaceae bacterium]|nr:tetratricopeptide repeat protein [Chthonomonadaceae bacterium]